MELSKREFIALYKSGDNILSLESTNMMDQVEEFFEMYNINTEVNSLPELLKALFELDIKLRFEYADLFLKVSEETNLN